MNLLQADFSELFRRHLCRHSQFGINVLHLVAVAGIYTSVLCLLLKLPAASWIIGALLIVYLAVLCRTAPAGVVALVAVAVGLFLGVALLIPDVPTWVHLLLIAAWHRFQVLNHRIYDAHHDMSGFADKYKKGPVLFLLLAFYELPILLQFLSLPALPNHAP
jgi:hypothetical protein